LPHFGVFDDVAQHLGWTAARLSAWAERVQGGIDEEGFVASVRAELTGSDPELREYYERAAPLWQSHAGLRRYWDKRSANGGNP
jgi:hypothetical protein